MDGRFRATEEGLLANRFGSRVRAARLARGWSQAKLAEMVQISPNHVGVIERGETVPSLETVHAYSRALGTSMGELLDAEPTGDAWLKEVVTIAQAVPPSKRALLLTILAGIVAALSRSEEEVRGKKSATSALERADSGMDELLERSKSVAPDDPKISVIVEILRGKTTDELEQALAVLGALRR